MHFQQDKASGVYHYRRRVPKELQSSWGKKQVKVSLKTKSKNQANLKAARLDIEFEEKLAFYKKRLSGSKLTNRETLEQAKEFFTQKRKAGLVSAITEMLVKDAAPEVTEGKMDEAKRAQVLADIDRAPTLKFSISEVSQAKDVNASGKIAGIKGKITINDNNRPVRQKEILKSIINSKIPTIIFEAGRFGNFGRWNRRGKMEWLKFHGWRSLFRQPGKRP